MAVNAPEQQQINAILGSVKIDRTATEVNYTYGAFITMLTQLLMQCNEQYETPTAGLVAVKLMGIFPSQLRHIVKPVVTEVTVKVK